MVSLIASNLLETYKALLTLLELKKVCYIVNILDREHKKSIFIRLLKARKVLFPNVGDYYIADICFFDCFIIWVTSLKKRNNILYFMRGERVYDVSGEEGAIVLVCLHLV